MNKEEVFSRWAPRESPWTTWAKPVLFAYADLVTADVAEGQPPGDLSWCPDPADGVVIVADLPGPDGVLLGVALAGRGYRPVPLYNAVPLPLGTPQIDLTTGKTIAAVDLLPVIRALRKGAQNPALLTLPAEAPPVFLLDANRAGGGRKMEPDEFDNRSFALTTDFPSANFLLSHGIRRILLVQRDRSEPQPDLAHILRRWQEAGLALERKRLDSSDLPERFEVSKPSWYGMMFQRALLTLGLHRSGSGGFGAWVPESGSGG